MPTTTLVPDSLTDSNSNVAAGAYTDIDETIASADGNTLDSVVDLWTGGLGTACAFSFTLTDLPADATTINTVQFRVRAKCTSTSTPVDDIAVYKCDVSGTNAPTTTAIFQQNNTSFQNKGASFGVSSSASVAEVNAWEVRVYQTDYSQEDETNPGSEGLNLEIDCIEIIVDYNTDPVDPPSEGPSSTNYTVIPTTDSSIYGLCIETARDFVVLGGLDADRYSIRWSAIGDPTDWPTPATDDARAKQSGSQTFPTRYGWVTAIAGDDFSMLIFQESAIHRATYVGGDVVWTFETIDESRGCVRQGRMVKADDLVFFQSRFGYHVARGGEIQDIGYGLVDDTFN